MQVPEINLNGTSRRQLLEQYLEVMTLLRKAIDALHQAAPNGRDYLPQGSPEAAIKLYRAQREQLDRVNRLETVWIEIEALAESVT